MYLDTYMLVIHVFRSSVCLFRITLAPIKTFYKRLKFKLGHESRSNNGTLQELLSLFRFVKCYFKTNIKLLYVRDQ